MEHRSALANEKKRNEKELGLSLEHDKNGDDGAEDKDMVEDDGADDVEDRDEDSEHTGDDSGNEDVGGNDDNEEEQENEGEDEVVSDDEDDSEDLVSQEPQLKTMLRPQSASTVQAKLMEQRRNLLHESLLKGTRQFGEVDSGNDSDEDDEITIENDGTATETSNQPDDAEINQLRQTSQLAHVQPKAAPGETCAGVDVDAGKMVPCSRVSELAGSAMSSFGHVALHQSSYDAHMSSTASVEAAHGAMHLCHVHKMNSLNAHNREGNATGRGDLESSTLVTGRCALCKVRWYVRACLHGIVYSPRHPNPLGCLWGYASGMGTRRVSIMTIRGGPCLTHGVLRHVLSSGVVLVPCASNRGLKRADMRVTLDAACFHGQLTAEEAEEALALSRWLCLGCCTIINERTAGTHNPAIAVQAEVERMQEEHENRRAQRRKSDTARQDRPAADITSAKRIGEMIGRELRNFFQGTTKATPPAAVTAVRNPGTDLKAYVILFPPLLVALLNGFLDTTVREHAAVAERQVSVLWRCVEHV